MSTTLSPLERDSLVRQFDLLAQEAPFQLLTPEQLSELGAIESDDAPIVSLYLDLGPESRRDRKWATVLKNLVRDAVGRIDDRREVRRVEAEVKHLERLVSKTLPDLGLGVALFASEPLGLLREVSLPLPLPNRLMVNRAPYLRPLFRVMDENDRFLVVVLDDHRARLFISQLGSIVEIADLVEEGPSLHSKGGWAQMRFQRHHDAHVLWHAGAVAHATGLALDRFAASRFLVAGTPDVLADYRGQLSPPVAERLAGEFKVMATASPSEIAAVALPVQREVEAQQELAMVRLLEEQPAGGKAAFGLDHTLRSLNEYRVRTLVLLDDYRAPGATCADDGQLTDGTEGLCPYCGEGIIPVDDVVDLALERAHRQGAAIELVRSEEARAQLSQKAPIAALLRY